MGTIRRKAGILLSITCAAALVSGCSSADLPNPFRRATAAPAVPVDLAVESQLHLREFDTAVRTLRESYTDPKALDAGWQAVVSEERAKIARGVSDAGFLNALRVVLGAVGDAELAAIPPDTTPTATTGTFAGIGVRIDLPREGRERILILHVYPESAAERAGLKPHDAIIAIEGTPVRFADRDALTGRLRGASGTNVTVTVRTPGQPSRDVLLTRRPVSPVEATVSRRLQNTNLGYIKPGLAPGELMRADVIDALRTLQADTPVNGIVLDLRTMQLSDFPLDGMLATFVNGAVGTRVVRTARAPEKLEVVGKNIAGSQVLPLVVLVSEFTTGPAESFTGVLQDLGRARIVGGQTAGRTTVISRFTLPNSGVALSIPTGEIRGAKNQSWVRAGVKPDIVSGQGWESFSQDNDMNLADAIAALSGK